MSALSRRSFLGTSLASLAASRLLGQDQPAEPKKIAEPKKPTENPAFQPNTLFLTWQRDPTTTMTVQWIGVSGETADTNIQFAKHAVEVEASAWQTQATATKPYPLTDFKVFRAELTGLTPGTEYQFRIGKNSPTYRFRTMPAKANDTIHFISGGDCGINPHTIANNIQAARQDPMFAVIGGDLGYDDGKKVDVSLAFIRNYSQQMIGRNGRLIPLIPCIGNHEVDGGFGKPREKAPFFYALFDGLYRESSYTTLDFGDYLSLVLLDTGHNSPIGGAQTDWLEKTLREQGDNISAELKSEVEGKIEATKKALATDDGEAINQAATDLSQTLQKIGTEMYGAAGGAAPSAAPGDQADGNTGSSGPDDEDVVEGEFTEAS